MSNAIPRNRWSRRHARERFAPNSGEFVAEFGLLPEGSRTLVFYFCDFLPRFSRRISFPSHLRNYRHRYARNSKIWPAILSPHSSFLFSSSICFIFSLFSFLSLLSYLFSFLRLFFFFPFSLFLHSLFMFVFLPQSLLYVPFSLFFSLLPSIFHHVLLFSLDSRASVLPGSSLWI